MRPIKTVGILLVIFFAVGLGCRESQDRKFTDVDSLKRSQLSEKGWVPRDIPPDARDIHVVTDLDAASAYGSFSLNNFSSLNAHCSELSDAIRLPRNAPSWFPAGLRTAHTPIELVRLGYKLMDCDNHEFGVAYQTRSQAVYFWSTRD
jgi:hypothetical protein